MCEWSGRGKKRKGKKCSKHQSEIKETKYVKKRSAEKIELSTGVAQSEKKSRKMSPKSYTRKRKIYKRLKKKIKIKNQIWESPRTETSRNFLIGASYFPFDWPAFQIFSIVTWHEMTHAQEKHPTWRHFQCIGLFFFLPFFLII